LLELGVGVVFFGVGAVFFGAVVVLFASAFFLASALFLLASALPFSLIPNEPSLGLVAIPVAFAATTPL